MNNIDINPEILNKINLIFKNVFNEVLDLDYRVDKYLLTKIEEKRNKISNLLNILRSIESSIYQVETSLREAQIKNERNIHMANKVTYIVNDLLHFHAKLSRLIDEKRQIEFEIEESKKRLYSYEKNLEQAKSNRKKLELKSSNLLERTSNKIYSIQKSTTLYQNTKMQDVTNNISNFINHKQNENYTLENTNNEHYNNDIQIDDLNFKLNYENNIFEIFIPKIEKKFFIKHKNSEIVVLNNDNSIINSIEIHYFQLLENVLLKLKSNKIKVWVNEKSEIDIYHNYGYIKNGIVTKEGVEMIWEKNE